MALPHIRPAAVADAADACEVLRRSIVELCVADHNNDPAFLASWLANKTPENVAAWITDPGNAVYVAVDHGRVAGIAAMTLAGKVTLNYVSPDARFRGISKALLTALERKASELGLAQCQLESTKTAVAFYRAAGYREQQDCAPGSCLPLMKALG